MKKIVLLSSLLLLSVSSLRAQFNVGGMLKDKVNNRASNAVSHSMDQALDSVQYGHGGKDRKQTSPGTGTPSATSQPSSQGNPPAVAQNDPSSVKAYQNYDFRAGDKIIFDDNFATDADGEFPAHWDLQSGQAVINKFDGSPSFLLTDGNYCIVQPRMKSKSYLTRNFSVEYDTYQQSGAYGMMIFFKDSLGESMDVYCSASSADWNGPSTTGKRLSGTLPQELAGSNYYNHWHHLAIVFKNDQLKVYVDQYRVLTVPHCDMNPAFLTCGGIGNQTNPIIFKNFRVADGASMNMLDELYTSGHFVTHGIHFDVNSATLKPESMGVINDVVNYMKLHADLKLEIDGHTDSDGGDELNQELSEQRAASVKEAIVSGGIDATRLSTKGYGASKPIAANDTPENKAQNRRVEFIKQ